MKKFTIILVCMLVCFTLFSGCTDKRNNDNQDIGNSVEINDTDISDADVDIDADVKADTETLPHGFTYTFKDPNNADGIVATPRE